MLKKLFKKNLAPKELFLQELLKKNTDLNLLNRMLSKGQVDINSKNKNYESYLHISLRAKKIQNALWLISKDIKLNTKDNQGITPFDIAINNQNHNIIRHILKNTKIDLNKKMNLEEQNCKIV